VHLRNTGQAQNITEARSRRRRATIQAVVMAGIGYLVTRHGNHSALGGAIIGLAAIVLASGWAIPPVFDAFDRFGNLVARAVGTALTWGLLALFYYVCFVPGRAILMVRRKDPLDRGFPGHKPSYWMDRGTPPDADRYRSQS